MPVYPLNRDIYANKVFFDEKEIIMVTIKLFIVRNAASTEAADSALKVPVFKMCFS